MKCELCGQEADFALSPDLDLEGLGTCKKHEKDMRMAYNILIFVGEKAYRDFIESKRKALAPPSPK